MNDRPPDDTGGLEPFRWWFEDEIDEELEEEYLGTRGELDVDLDRPARPPSPSPSPITEPAPAPEHVVSQVVVPEAPTPAPAELPDAAQQPVAASGGDEAAPDELDDAVSAPPRRARHRRHDDTPYRRLRPPAIAAGLVGLVLIAAVAVTAPWDRLRPDGATPQARSTAAASPIAAAGQDTLLLVRHGPDDTGPALGITLLATGQGGSAVVFIPRSTIVDVPGFGQDRLGLAFQYGGAALVEASLENLLGIDIDHAAAVSNSGLAALLARTGGLDVELDEQLVARSADGAARVRFEPGAQFLDGERLVELWDFRQRGESELDTFPRQQLVWGEMLAAASDPQVVRALTAGGAPQLQTSADADFLSSVLSDLAEAQDAGSVSYTLLPVTPFGAANETGAVTYRPTPDGVERLVEGPLAGSVPPAGSTQGIRIQVLNGVGTPGIGQDVDRRLEGAGFRIVLTDNARSFDFETTRILIYAEDERSLAAAEQVQRRLGVGTIQVSRQPQSVVDLTIIVGADFTASDRNKPDEGDPFPAPEEQSS